MPSRDSAPRLSLPVVHPRAKRFWSVLAAIGLTATVLTALAARLDPALTQAGWRASVEPERATGSAQPPVSVPGVEALYYLRPSPARLASRITWAGTLLVSDAGRHRFWIRRGGAVRFWIDRRLVIASPEETGMRVETCEVDLGAGNHQVALEYAQPEARGDVQVWWRQPSGATRRLEEASDALAPHSLPRRMWRWRPLTTWLPAASVFAWLLGLLALLAGAGAALMRRLVPEEEFWHGLGPWIGAGALACAWAFWWGLPEFYGVWAADEIGPGTLLNGLDRGFGGGWADKYPPLHFYVLSLPALVADRAGALCGIDVHGPAGPTVLHPAMRLVSVTMAVGALLAVGVLGHRSAGKVCGRLAIVLLTLSPTWLYYAKVANVDMPYVFWLAWALVAFATFLERPREGTAFGLALVAACAVATKDQVAAFFVLMPAGLIVANVSRWRARGVARPEMRAVADPLWAACALLAAVVLAVTYQWPLNRDLIGRHLALMVEARYAPMVPPTLDGVLQLLRLVWQQVAFLHGWPVFGLALLGVVANTADRRHPILLWLLVPALSYVVFFIGQARYSYDRFLLGLGIVVAVFAADMAGRLLSVQGRWRGVARAGVALVFLYSAGYGLGINAMMAGDSRLETETFLRRHVAPGQTVGFVGWRQYLPRLTTFAPIEIVPSRSALLGARPDWLVLNERFVRRWRLEPETWQFFDALERGDLGCVRAMSQPSAAPWWAFAQYTTWLGQPGESGYTNLDKISPPIAVYSCFNAASESRVSPSAAATGPPGPAAAARPGG